MKHRVHCINLRGVLIKAPPGIIKCKSYYSHITPGTPTVELSGVGVVVN